MKPETHAKLLHRAKRLVRLIEIGAPDILIANEVQLVTRTMYAHAGPAMTQAAGDWLVATARREAWLCQECDTMLTQRRLMNGEDLCGQCAAKHDEIIQTSLPPEDDES